MKLLNHYTFENYGLFKKPSKLKEISAMSNVPKEDIGILTEQLLLKKREIYDALNREHIEIDPSYLSANFLPKLDVKLKKITEPNLSEPQDEDTEVTLEDMEAIIGQFDILEKKIDDMKGPTANPNAANTSIVRRDAANTNMIRRDTHSAKRFGSMNDVSKISRTTSSSTQNLNATKLFVEPQAPVLRPNAACNKPFVPKVTSEQLAQHNSLKDELQSLAKSDGSDDNSCATLMNDISQKYTASFDRLTKFFGDIQQINLVKSAESGSNSSLKALDQDLLNSMNTLSKASSEVQFMAKNKHLYKADGIKSIDSTLSDDLTHILDECYRAN